MGVEEFLNSKLIELNINNADDMGYRDMIIMLDEYANLKALELKAHVTESLSKKYELN